MDYGPVCFVDTETTGLDPDRHQIWEVALILPDGAGYVWQLPVDLARADPIALNIGRFHERRVPEMPTWEPHKSERILAVLGGQTNYVVPPELMAEWAAVFVLLTRGLHIVGAGSLLRHRPTVGVFCGRMGSVPCGITT